VAQFFFETQYKRATFFLTVESCRHGYMSLS